MEPVDQSEELRRLEELYAQMSEDELRALADNVNDLTEIAQQALRAEMSKRGLEMQARDAPADELAAMADDLIDVWEAKDMREGRLLKDFLQSAGLASCLVPDDVKSVDESKKNSDEGVTVKVMERDFQRARNVIEAYFAGLKELHPSTPLEPGDETEYVARCPKCHSPDIVFQRLDAEAAGTPVANPKFNWSCDACGHQWQDDGNEEKY
jgi:DNA-directed RNA polymerase subunit M/transcription elongation factor TFIIS